MVILDRDGIKSSEGNDQDWGRITEYKHLSWVRLTLTFIKTSFTTFQAIIILIISSPSESELCYSSTSLFCQNIEIPPSLCNLVLKNMPNGFTIYHPKFQISWLPSAIMKWSVIFCHITNYIKIKQTLHHKSLLCYFSIGGPCWRYMNLGLAWVPIQIETRKCMFYTDHMLEPNVFGLFLRVHTKRGVRTHFIVLCTLE